MSKKNKTIIDLVETVLETKTKEISPDVIAEPEYKTKTVLIGYEKGRYNLEFPVEDIGGWVEKECSSKRTFYELEVLNVIKEFNLTGVYIDCGGYIGNHALFFANHTNATKVFSFEPNNTSFNCLKNNLRNQSKIKIFNLGVSDSAQTLQLYRAGTYDGCCDSVEEYPKNKDKKQLITTDTLDAIMPQLLSETDNVVFLKLDIEGHEIKALKGAEAIIDKYKPMIYTEIWREFNTFQDIYEFLTSKGYVIHRMEGQHYYWKYSIDKSETTKKIYNTFITSLGKTKAAVIETLLDNMLCQYKVYTTNVINIEESRILEHLGMMANIKYPNYKLYGFSNNTNVFSYLKNKLTTKKINSHIYLANSLEGLSIFTGRDILVLNLELKDNGTLVDFIKNNVEYLTTIREEGAVIITIPNVTLIEETIYNTFVDTLLKTYKLELISETRIRYFYHIETIDNTRTFYIRF